MTKKAWIYLGSEFRRLRENKLSISQVEFSKSLGISKSLVCKAESGERKYSQEVMEKIFDIFSLDDYDKLKLLVLSELPTKLKNTEEECYNVIKLTIELKNNGLFPFAKSLIDLSLETFDDSVDFYVLLSTVNLMENRYDDSEKNIIIALNLYKNGFKSISSESDIYHNYGNIFFKKSYSYEFKRLEIVNSYYKENKSIINIESDTRYINITNKIKDLYLKTEEYFDKAFELNRNSKHIIAQMGRLYFNLVNIDIKNIEYIEKAYYFLSLIQEYESLKINERVELSVFLTIIMSIKSMYNQALLLLNNLICFIPDNFLVYYAKAIAFTYKSNGDDPELLNKSFENILKTLDVSKNNQSVKMQIIADFNFDLIRNNELTKHKFNNLFL